MAFHPAQPQGKMYMAARCRYAFSFWKTSKSPWRMLLLRSGEKRLPVSASWKKWKGERFGRQGMNTGKKTTGRGGSERSAVWGRESERETVERSPRSPLVLCRTFSFDPPMLSSSLPSHTPPSTHKRTHTHIRTHNTHTQYTHTGQQICRIQ